MEIGEDETESVSQCVIYSRTKEDIFHEFKHLPLGKTCPITPNVHQLLIHATFVFDQEGFNKLSTVLRQKSDKIKTNHDLYTHFYHNKEYWRQRVQMTTPDAEVHASNIRQIHEFFKTNSEMLQYCNKEVEDYFNSFEDKARRGLFDELDDVNLFRSRGKDSDGLDLWWRLKGSTRDENWHQKMKSCIGSHSVGAQVAHYLLLLLAYRYNINTGITRCNEPNHGHIFLGLIDRIQIRTQQLYGVLLYPNHPNVSLFQPIPNFIAVGIGPLSYNARHVKIGDPNPNLKGDANFMAERMRVENPPLGMNGRDEIRMYNQFKEKTPTPKYSDFDKLAQEYLRMTNGTTIFPKTISQLQAYDKIHTKNALIKIAQANMKDQFNEILHKLANVCTSVNKVTAEGNNAPMMSDVPIVSGFKFITDQNGATSVMDISNPLHPLYKM